jgi:hypothetical protein
MEAPYKLGKTKLYTVFYTKCIQNFPNPSPAPRPSKAPFLALVHHPLWVRNVNAVLAQRRQNGQIDLRAQIELFALHII